MNIICALLAFFIGMAMNVQSGVNGQIRAITENPVFASTVNFSVGMIALLILLFITCKAGIYKMPSRQLLVRETKWWMYTGGPLGIIYVMAGILLPPLIGYGAFFSTLVTGQLVFSAAIDHNGWMGNAVTKIDKRRALGILLLIAGAVIVQSF